MSDLLSPITLLSQNWIDLIRSEAIVAEKQGNLTKKQLNLIYEQGWFQLLVPSVYGGKQMSLPEVLKIEEALAEADGSLGWVVTLCAGAGWFGGFINNEYAREIFTTPQAYLAGSGAVNGKAEISSGQYVISGNWPYATGAPDATAFTANCTVTENGVPVTDESGNNKVVAVVLQKKEIDISGKWNGFGMIATASHSYEVKNLKVNEDRIFDIKKAPVVHAPIYYYPFHQFAEATLTVNLTGMGLHFMELCGNIIAEKSKSQQSGHVNFEALQNKYDVLLQKLQVARQKLYYAVDMSWQICQANKEISLSLLYKVSAASYTAVSIVRDCVNTLYPYCGLKAADRDSEINRVWRDIQTASQHSMLIGDGN